MDSDVQQLANVMYHEARGESQQGQIAVGQVVMNRVRSGKYPSTVRGVIWQRGQFSGIRQHRVPQRFLDLAAGIIAEKYPNYVGNALNFNALRRKGCKIRIGAHCFF